MHKVVQDIMTRDVVTINELQTTLQAAIIMSEKGISSLIVVRDSKPVGIITERDFVKKICAKKIDVSVAKICEIMSKIQTFADPETPIDVAVQRMINHRIRRLPVLSNGKIVGIVTVTDLAKHLRTTLLIEGSYDDNSQANSTLQSNT